MDINPAAVRVGRPGPEDRIRDFDDMVGKNKKLPTKAGIPVASHGEQLITDTLWSSDVPFDYDVLLHLSEDGEELTLEEEKERRQDGELVFWVRPDFRIKGTKIVIEYWGMTGGRSEDELESEHYDHKRERKKGIYDQAGFELIEINREHFYHLESELRVKIREAEAKLRDREKEPELGFKIQEPEHKDITLDDDQMNCAKGIHKFPEQDYGVDEEVYCDICGESNRNRRRKGF